MLKIAGILVIFALAALLAGRQGVERFVSNNVTPTALLVVAALLFVAFHTVKGSNPLLKGLFALSGVIAFLVLVFGLIALEQDAKSYVMRRLCDSPSTFGRIVRNVVCVPLGLR